MFFWTKEEERNYLQKPESNSLHHMASSSPPAEEQYVTMDYEKYETTCWGCGLRLLLETPLSVTKCGWCGAITNPNKRKHDKKCVTCRRVLDRSIVSFVTVFILSIIVGGMWAVLPPLFSVGLVFGIFHSTVAAILSIATILSFSLAAFRSAATPSKIVWEGSYPAVGKGDLDDYNFCHYCLKPKPPRTHHCRSCDECILYMDHHCPFIGNCVGAANHRSFIAFLISAVVSSTYVCIMSAYTSLHLWPPISMTFSFGHVSGPVDGNFAWRIIGELMLAFLRSIMLLSPRGIVLIFLFVASFALQLGISVLLWQQIYYIYEGETYLSHLSMQSDDNIRKGSNRDCKNLVSFFGFPYSVQRFLPNFMVHQKIHTK